MGKLQTEFQTIQNQVYQSGKQSCEQLLCELVSTRQRTRESLASLRSEIRLEINLERGKQRDAALGTALKYQDLMTQVESETGNAYATLAKLRHDIFYSLTGFMFTSIAAFFGYLRLTTS